MIDMPLPQYTAQNKSMLRQLAYPNFTTFEEHRAMYSAMVHWIRNICTDYENTASWSTASDCIYISFTNEATMLLFILQFGPGVTH
jgi:hypothetical protein